MDYIKKRLSNVAEFFTSKKVAVTVLSAILIVWVVKSTPAIAGIAAIAAAYLIGQSFVDSKK